MEWYSKCARDAFEQVVASRSPTTAHLTQPTGYIRRDARQEPCTAAATSGASATATANSPDKPDSFSIVQIAGRCADHLFCVPQEEYKTSDDDSEPEGAIPTEFVFVERAAINYFEEPEEERSFLQEWFDRFLVQVAERSSEYKDRSLVLASDYKYRLDDYVDAKKTELDSKIREELKMARELAYKWAQELMLNAKLKAHDAKEKALVAAENYSTLATTYALKKGDEYAAIMKDDLSYRQEIAKEWAKEFAMAAKQRSIDASHRGYVLAEAFAILAHEKSIEAARRGYVLAGTCRDNVVIFVEEKGGELADKVRIEVRNTAKFVEESANELLKEARTRVGGKLSLKELCDDDDAKRRPSKDKRAIEKAEELQAELTRSAETAQKWAEDLAKEARKLSDRIKDEDLVAKFEKELKKAFSGMEDSSAQLNEEARRRAAEAEEQAKEVFDKFQKEMQASVEQAQKWTAELAAAASKQAEITDKRGKELIEMLRKELELAEARRKEFSVAANTFVNEKRKELGDWCTCTSKKQAAREDANKHLKEAEKHAALLAEEAKLTAAALGKLAMDYSEEAKKKSLQLKERAQELAAQLLAAQKQVETFQKELKDLEEPKK